MRPARRDASTFDRLWAVVQRWRFGDGPHVDVAAAWRTGTRDTSARLLAALVREGAIDGRVGDHALVVPRLGLEVPLSGAGAFGLCWIGALHRADPLLDDPVGLWHRLAPELALGDEAVLRVATELADSAFNLALAEAAARACPPWARAHRHDPRAIDPEHHVTGGHPWHPMTKSRVGLSLREHAMTAPELGARAWLSAVDVPTAFARASSALADAVAPWLGRAAAGHVRIPAHELQLARLRRSGVLARVQARPVHVRVPVRSLLGLRTVAVEGGPHVKLALDVHTTSARRVVSPMSVHNGPLVSALLRRIAAADAIVGRVRIVGEDASAGLRPEVGADAGRLGAIVRAPEDFEVPHGSSLWVCAGLGSLDPIMGRAWIDAACAGHPGDPAARAHALLDRIIDGLAIPTVRLLVAWGIALEAHLQNTLVHVASGQAVGFRVRDLGGIRIHRGRLHAAGEHVELATGSFTITDDLHEVQTKLVHTLLHATLGSVIRWLHESLGFAPDRGWARVREGLVAALDTWALEPRLAAACAEDRAVWLAPRQRAKALLTMRMRDAVSDYSYVEVDNPLADAGRSATTASTA